MVLPSNLLLPDGSLNDEVILKREILYKGMNGKNVERFFLSPAKSFVFKPLTNNEQIGKEVWIYQNVLPSFPNVYPKMISFSEHPDQHWIIFEDLGQLKHEFNEDSAAAVIKLISWWHSLPVNTVKNVPLSGPKPSFEVIMQDVLLRKEEILSLLPFLGMEAGPIKEMFKQLLHIRIAEKKVLSHGDLHLGNYSIVNGELVVLDWEHTHLNVPYWDLFHVIDMSHPDFPKDMTHTFRKWLLKTYLAEVSNAVEEEKFIKEYLLFSSVFSIWMTLLILKDLNGNGGKWTKEQLQRQLKETLSSLQQCVNSLLPYWQQKKPTL